MKFTLACAFATLGILAVAACGGRSVAPTQPFEVMPQAFTPTSGPNGIDPCKKLSSFTWYFKGPCIAQTIQKNSTEFKLKNYKGVAQSVTYPPPSGSVLGDTVFVTGEGTGRSDISGTSYGSKFPFYGTKGVPCENPSSSTVPCPGKLLMYDLMDDTSKNNLTFTAGPTFKFTTAKDLTGKSTCTVNELTQAFSSSGSSWFYIVSPVTGRVKDRSVIIPGNKTYKFEPAHNQMVVLAISCK
ncbi:MAG: hypothetical protein JO302_04490 [Candidatus Eremiobacteraeota bacterium]|nr:hypothetical protein [Candidatus Eremiobacteraeota bacterium]